MGQRRAASGVTLNRRDLEWPRSHGADQVGCRIALLAVAQHEGSCLAAILGPEVYLSSPGGEDLLLAAPTWRRSSLGLNLRTLTLGPRLAVVSTHIPVVGHEFLLISLLPFVGR